MTGQPIIAIVHFKEELPVGAKEWRTAAHVTWYDSVGTPGFVYMKTLAGNECAVPRENIRSIVMVTP